MPKETDNVAVYDEIPGLEEGEVPELPPDRPNEHIITQAAADPVFDNDIIPLTYTNSRWYAYVYRADMDDLERITPDPLEVVDDKVEFWYVDHDHTMLGPYLEMGITIACEYEDYKGGYYPYMYLSQDSAIFAGREPFGFPKKKATIDIVEHGGGNDRGDQEVGKDTPGDFFSHALERRGWLMHTSTGKYDDEGIPFPEFYGDPEWGRFNMKLTTSPDVQETEWNLTFLDSEWQGEHRFQLRDQTIRTASPDAINSWFFQGTPFDNAGAMIPPQELLGMVAFNFDLIIPPAETVWSKTVERTEDEVLEHAAEASPYEYTMRHDFPKPRYK